MSAESEILERRKLAVQTALPRIIQAEEELRAAQSKVKQKKENIKAIYGALANHGVGEAAFKEARKRAAQDQDELNLFDSESCEVEDWLRRLAEGEQLVESDGDDGATRVDDLDEDGEELTEEEVDAIPWGAEGRVAAEEYRDPDFEEDPEPPHVVHQRQQDAKAEQEALAHQARPRTVRVGRGKGNVVELPPPDPQAKAKTQAAQADAGSDGFSANDIPMPKTTLHTPAPAQPQTGFVDRTERMTAQEANELLGTGTD